MLKVTWHICSYSDSMVYEWDIATGTCVRSMQGHSAGLTGIWVISVTIVLLVINIRVTLTTIGRL